jgi:hypothetical protein
MRTHSHVFQHDVNMFRWIVFVQLAYFRTIKPHLERPLTVQSGVECGANAVAARTITIKDTQPSFGADRATGFQ